MDDDTRALYLCQIARLNAAEAAHVAAIKEIRQNRQALRADMIAVSLGTQTLGVSAPGPSRPSSCP